MWQIKTHYTFPMYSNSSEDSRHSYGLLATVRLSQLKGLKVVVKRGDFANPQPLRQEQQFIIEIDDPRAIVPLVHIKKGITPTSLKSIFDRQDVLVNPPDTLTQPCHTTRQQNSPCPVHDSKRKSTSRSLSRSRRSTERRSYERRYQSTDRSLERERSPRSRNRDRSLSRQRSKDRYSSQRDRSTSRDTRRRLSADRGISSRRETTSRYPSRPRSREKISPKRRSKDRRSPRRTSADRRLPRHTSADRRSPRRTSVDRGSSRRRTADRSLSPRRKSTERESRYRTADRSPSKKPYAARRSYSREREGYQEKKRSITPLKPGEYRPNHPDLKRKLLERDDPDRNIASKKLRTSNSTDRNRSRRSRSNSASHSKRRSRSPGVSPSSNRREYERGRRRRRSRSRTPLHYGDPNVDFGYYEGIPGAEFWMHPGIHRPGFPLTRCHPPAFYPRGLPPGATVLYPPRFPFIPPLLRQRFPVYNIRQKPKLIPKTAEESTTIGGDSAAGATGNNVEAVGSVLAIE